MKARTKAILKAAEDNRLLNCVRWVGVCECISAQNDAASEWFYKLFQPDFKTGEKGIDGNDAWWLGWFTPENLPLRLTFLAMAAAVSETED